MTLNTSSSVNWCVCAPGGLAGAAAAISVLHDTAPSSAADLALLEATAQTRTPPLVPAPATRSHKLCTSTRNSTGSGGHPAAHLTIGSAKGFGASTRLSITALPALRIDSAAARWHSVSSCASADAFARCSCSSSDSAAALHLRRIT
jgi:hypothetical protein